MALKPLVSGRDPLCFDGYDGDYLRVKGGEILQLSSVAVPGADLAAQDSFDGYVNTSAAQKRPVLKLAFGTSGPAYLADDGVAGYGTLFGTVVGAVSGKGATGGAVLGPHTATGSGKLTAWDKPGLYAVSLDACDPDATDGLQPTNTVIAPGDPLCFYIADSGTTAATRGFLTPRSGGDDGGAVGSKVVGTFVEFATNGALVNTPNYLVAALNSPSGTSAQLGRYSFAVFNFIGTGF